MQGFSLNASDAAVTEIVAAADVWDMTLPWSVFCGQDLEVLARYKRAGYTFVSLTLTDTPPTFEGTRRRIGELRELVEAQAADWLTFGASIEQIDRGRREGKLVLGLHAQETRLIGEDLSRIEALHALGLRHMLLAYNVRNLVADGCAEVADGGLSNFGRAVVREMNRVGMLVDCAHTGRRSSLEAIELSERPAMFSHTGVYALCAHIRNIHDDQIRACASRGGIIGVFGLGAFLGDPQARAETVFRHIDYIANLVGPEHVGIGTDYVNIFPIKNHLAAWTAINASHKRWPDPAFAWPNPGGKQMRGGDGSCFQPEQLAELIAIMLAHGYSTEAIKGILGGNFRRLHALLP